MLSVPLDLNTSGIFLYEIPEADCFPPFLLRDGNDIKESSGLGEAERQEKCRWVHLCCVIGLSFKK